jgi:hypothetical protein
MRLKTAPLLNRAECVPVTDNKFCEAMRQKYLALGFGVLLSWSCMSARSKEQTKLPDADLENVDAYMARAEAFMKMHRPEDAAHQLDLAIAKFGSSEILFAMRGGTRFNHDDYRDAAADFSAAIGYNSQRAYYFIMR